MKHIVTIFTTIIATIIIATLPLAASELNAEDARGAVLDSCQETPVYLGSLSTTLDWNQQSGALMSQQHVSRNSKAANPQNDKCKRGCWHEQKACYRACSKTDDPVSCETSCDNVYYTCLWVCKLTTP